MQQKQLLWLVGILIVLGGLAYGTGAFDKASSTVDVPSLSFAGNEIQQITISSASGRFKLAKQQDAWRIVEPVQGRADTTLVSQFLSSIEEMALESLVSTNAERYERFGVDSTATRALLEWSNGQQGLYLGITGPDFQSFYTRIDGDPAIYLAKGRMNAPTDADRWRDKRILTLDPTSVQRVVLESPGHNFAASYETGMGWGLNEAGAIAEADSAEVMTWLNRFRSLTGTGFSDETTSQQVQDEATHSLQFTYTDGTSTTIWMLENEDSLLATATNLENTYTLSSAQLGSYFPDPSRLKP